MANWGVKPRIRKSHGKSRERREEGEIPRKSDHRGKSRRKARLSNKLTRLDEAYVGRRSLSSVDDTYLISTESSFSRSSYSSEERTYSQRERSRHSERTRSDRRGKREQQEMMSRWRGNIEQYSESDESYYEIVDSDEEEEDDVYDSVAEGTIEEQDIYTSLEEDTFHDSYNSEDYRSVEEDTVPKKAAKKKKTKKKKKKKDDVQEKDMEKSVAESTMAGRKTLDSFEYLSKEEADEIHDDSNETADPFALPSPTELSEELCKLVSRKNICYSQFRRSALQSLITISGWVETHDPTFLKHFLTYGGVVKVLDFLQEVLREEEEHKKEDQEGETLRIRIAVECIHLAAGVIAGVCSMEEPQDKMSTDDSCHSRTLTVSPRFLAGITGTVIVDHGGIEILLLASDLCSRVRNKKKKKEDIFTETNKPDSSFDNVEPALEASEKIWEAIANTCSCVDNGTMEVISEKLLVFLFDTGFEIMEAFPLDPSSLACPKTNGATYLLMACVFRVFTRMFVRFRDGCDEKKHALEEEDVLNRALEALSGKCRCSCDDLATFATGISSISMSFRLSATASGTREEEIYTEEVLAFFFECQSQGLLFQTKSTSTTVSTTSSEASQSLDDNVMDDQWKHFCEGIVPVCVSGLQSFAVENQSIRKNAVQILDACICSINKNAKQQNLLTELTEGTLEALGPCLASETLDDTEKYEIKEVVRKIAVVIYSTYIGEFGPSGSCQEGV